MAELGYRRCRLSKPTWVESLPCFMVLGSLLIEGSSQELRATGQGRGTGVTRLLAGGRGD